MTLSEAEEILASFRCGSSVTKLAKQTRIRSHFAMLLLVTVKQVILQQQQQQVVLHCLAEKVNAGKGSFHWEFRIANLPKRGF